jgi:hypothetical protein
MEWTVELVHHPRYVRVTTRGGFNVGDHLAMIEDILTRPFWQPGTAALFDHRQLDMAGATYAVMAAASQNHLRHDGRIGAGKAAVIMGSAADFGSARQFEMLVEGHASAALRVFLDPVAALAWLTSEPESTRTA